MKIVQRAVGVLFAICALTACAAEANDRDAVRAEVSAGKVSTEKLAPVQCSTCDSNYADQLWECGGLSCTNPTNCMYQQSCFAWADSNYSSCLTGCDHGPIPAQ